MSDAVLPVARQLLGSLSLRPYVFGFLGLYLVVAAAAWGWRRAWAFAWLAGGLALLAEWSSTRIGVPFGLYHYTGTTRGAELYLGNVPLFDPLSFIFLAYASLGVGRRLLRRWADAGPAAAAPPLAQAVTTGILMMWLDLVIDPLAVRGDRWFLGRIFYYPEPGPYFGVPVANFAGWAILGTAIAAGWLLLEPRLGGAPPRWAARLPGQAWHPLALYYLVLGFNVAVTARVAEPALLWAGIALHLPLAALVVSSGRPRPPARGRPDRGDRPG